MCARVLGSLELEEVREIIESDTFPLVSQMEGTINLHAQCRVPFKSMSHHFSLLWKTPLNTADTYYLEADFVLTKHPTNFSNVVVFTALVWIH